MDDAIPAPAGHPGAAPPPTAPHRPSPPWVGLTATAILFTGFLGQISYTLLAPPWQASLGGWNYAIGWVLIVSSAVLLRQWRGEPSGDDESEAQERGAALR